MSANTSIEWTDRTWNPVRGCSLVSEGCRNCYAMKQANRFSGGGQPYEGLTELGPAGPRWTGKIRTVDEALTEPLRWRKPQRVFVNSMSDLFHEGVADEFIDRVFAVMALAQRHTFQILTKRPARMQAYLSDSQRRQRVQSGGEVMRPSRPPAHWYHVSDWSMRLNTWPLPNVWLGVSCENQQTADERIPLLLLTPAAVRFLSCEPLLGPIDLEHIPAGPICPQLPEHRVDVLRAGTWDLRSGFIAKGQPDFINHSDMERLDWVIVGGESGVRPRPMHPDWARTIRNQCTAAGVRFFFKQWGAWQDGSAPPDLGEIVLNDGRHARAVEQFTADDRYRWDKLRPTVMARVGKKAAGRELDGEIWGELPGVDYSRAVHA